MSEPTTAMMPQKQQHTYYDYHACCEYLQARDGYDERDVAGKWSSPTPDEVPYQDFWHFVCDREHGLRNDSFFTMCEWWGDEAEPWQQAILEKYLSTFGERDPHTGARFVEFFVSW